jgi:hypothetical protein
MAFGALACERLPSDTGINAESTAVELMVNTTEETVIGE